jgi:VWFA-related protein
MLQKLLPFTATLILLSPQEEVRYRVDVMLRTIDVSVTELGQPVSTLNKGDFALYVDGERQDIQTFDVIDSPHRILAMSQCKNNLADDALLQKTFARLVEGVVPQNRLALIEFLPEIKLHLDWDSLRGPVAIALHKPGTCDVGVQMNFDQTLKWILSKSQAVAGRKAVVWFSPSIPQMQYSQVETPFPLRTPTTPRPVKPEADTAFQAALTALQNSGLAFNFVTVKQGPDSSVLSKIISKQMLDFPDFFEEQERAVLLRLKLAAEATGGRLFIVKQPDDILPLVDQLNRFTGTFYTLGYAPTKKTEESKRIEVGVRDPKLRVWHSP